MKQITALFLFFGFLGTVTYAQQATLEPPQAGDSRIDDSGIEQVYVPSGCFLMGTSDVEVTYALTLDAPTWAAGRLPSEQSQHEVCISTGYWIDTTEVTNGAFAAFVEAEGYTTEAFWSEDGWKWLGRQRSTLPARC